MNQALSIQGPVEQVSTEARRAMWGGFFGFFVDMFDVYLPVVALTPAITYFEPKNLAASTTSTISAIIFAITLVGRPIGALIFGHFGDRIGRRRTAMISVGGFGIATLLMGLLPGYEQWGIAGLVILIALRLIDGIFLGGEYTSASTLAIEYAPKEKRGLYGAIIMGGFPLGYVAIAVITTILLHLMPSQGLHSAYVQWGWRIPYFIGAILAAVFVLYYKYSIHESEIWISSKKSPSPLKDLFRGENARNFWQVFITMSGLWLSVNMIVAVMPVILISVLHITSSTVTFGLIIFNVLVFLSYLVIGQWSQHVGRKPILLWMGAVIAVLGSICYYFLVTVAATNVALAMVLAAICSVLIVSVWGLITTYINERFQTSVRSSGFGLGYSLAVIIPSFYTFIMLWLQHLMPYKYTEIPLVVLGGILVIIGAAMGPETKDVEFTSTLS